MPFRYWALVGSTRTWTPSYSMTWSPSCGLVVEVELVAEARSSRRPRPPPGAHAASDSPSRARTLLDHLDGVRGQRDDGLGGGAHPWAEGRDGSGRKSTRTGRPLARPSAHRVRWACHSSASCVPARRSCGIRAGPYRGTVAYELLNCPFSPTSAHRCKRSHSPRPPIERRPSPSRPSRAPRRSSRSAGVLLAVGTLAVVVVDPEAAVVPARTSASSSSARISCYSLVLFVLVRGEHVRQERIGYLSTAADIVWVSVITIFTERGPSPFFLLHVFVISSVSVRWGLAGAVPGDRRSSPSATRSLMLRREPADRQRGPRVPPRAPRSARSICSRPAI